MEIWSAAQQIVVKGFEDDNVMPGLHCIQMSFIQSLTYRLVVKLFNGNAMKGMRKFALNKIQVIF